MLSKQLPIGLTLNIRAARGASLSRTVTAAIAMTIIFQNHGNSMNSADGARRFDAGGAWALAAMTLWLWMGTALSVTARGSRLTRETSAESYQQIEANGLLGKRQFQVYDVLFRKGPLTGNQIWETLKAENEIDWISNQGAGSRLSELRNMGCVRECGIARDPFTKMNVILWDVTRDLPVKIEKRKSKDQIIQEQVREISDLRQRIKLLADATTRTRFEDGQGTFSL